jgi:transposase InsO family protein
VVKAEQLTQWERERRSAATRVTMLPGVVRGFDAIDVSGVPVLVSADGAVPYRTSVRVAARYDTEAVAEAVAKDFAEHGAPLVWRVDRWKAHVTEPVRAVLEEHQVLLMHGPPRHPRFYGQLERQNREHRAWFDTLNGDVSELQRECESMREAFNELVPRRTLGWRTAGAAWRSRVRVAVDRRELKQEVDERIAKLVEQEALRGAYPGLVERLAIQAALTQRGLLRLTKGGWC